VIKNLDTYYWEALVNLGAGDIIKMISGNIETNLKK